MTSNLFARFQNEFLVTITPMMDTKDFQDGYKEYSSSWGTMALSVQNLLAIYATYVLYKRHKKQSSSFLVFLTAELAALVLILWPLFLPMSHGFMQIRYLSALSAFVTLMTIHSRLHNTTHTENSFLDHLASTFLHDLPQKCVHAIPAKMMDWCYLLFFSPYVTMWVIVDVCTYLMVDWIPVHVSTTNGIFICQSLMASMVVCFGIRQVLDVEAAISCCLGYPLPMDMRHKNPLMSISFSEFWGLRWNPIIGKLLQGSFYKPLRRMGVPQSLCVMGCFIGSGLFHAWPVYVSTFNLTYASWALMFFVANGFLVISEKVFFTLMGWSETPVASRTSPRIPLSPIVTIAKEIAPSSSAPLMVNAVTAPALGPSLVANVITLLKMKISMPSSPSGEKKRGLFGQASENRYRVSDGIPLTPDDVLSFMWQSLFGGVVGAISAFVMKVSSMIPFQSIFGQANESRYRVSDGAPLTPDDVLSFMWQSLFGVIAGIISAFVMKVSSMLSLQSVFGQVSENRYRVSDGAPLTSEEVMSYVRQYLFGTVHSGNTVATQVLPILKPEMDPFGPSKGLNMIPYVGEICLLFGMFLLTYVGCEGLDTILSMPMGFLVVLGGISLILVAMVCMWYTQWIYGAYDREVQKMMMVIYPPVTTSPVSQPMTNVVTPSLPDQLPVSSASPVAVPPVAASPVAVSPVAASPVIATKKTLSTTDITSIAEIDNFISPFISPTITPSITRRNSFTKTVTIRSSEASEQSEAIASLNVIPESHDENEYDVQAFQPVQTHDQSMISKTTPSPSVTTIPWSIHLRVLLYFTVGWMWTMVSLSMLMPLFSMSFYYSMGDSPMTKSILTAPLVRAVQGYLTQK